MIFDDMKRAKCIRQLTTERADIDDAEKIEKATSLGFINEKTTQQATLTPSDDAYEDAEQ